MSYPFQPIAFCFHLMKKNIYIFLSFYNIKQILLDCRQNGRKTQLKLHSNRKKSQIHEIVVGTFLYGDPSAIFQSRGCHIQDSSYVAVKLLLQVVGLLDTLVTIVRV